MSCPEKFIDYMHDFLDEDINAEHEQELRGHLKTCQACENHFMELKKATAFVQSTAHIKAPDYFKAKIMASLPKEKRKVEFNRWFKKHPFLSAAILFLVLMSASILSSWNQEQQFSFSKQPSLVVENDTVIIPKGEVVKGDIVVRNGKVKIEGEVQGDVTVINGEQYLASAGNVTGEIVVVNEIFEWIWYHIKETVKNTVNLIEVEDKEQSL